MLAKVLILFLKLTFVPCGTEALAFPSAPSIADPNHMEIKSPAYFESDTHMVNLYVTVFNITVKSCTSVKNTGNSCLSHAITTT